MEDETILSPTMAISKIPRAPAVFEHIFSPVL